MKPQYAAKSHPSVKKTFLSMTITLKTFTRNLRAKDIGTVPIYYILYHKINILSIYNIIKNTAIKDCVL